MEPRALRPYPGYEDHFNHAFGLSEGKKAVLPRHRTSISDDAGVTAENLTIENADGGSMLLRIVRPQECEPRAPIILDIHGGGWIAGTPYADDARNAYLAAHTPCIVAAVDYRLADGEVAFPAPLLDCLCAYKWLKEHARELGGDPDLIGLNGTSSGGNLAAALALYLRDHGMPQPVHVVLNCPHLTMDMTASQLQFGSSQMGTRGLPMDIPYCDRIERTYLGSAEMGALPSYYAMPGYCFDVSGLGSTQVVVAEYDKYRDGGLDYAYHLLKAGVPCEIFSAPRVAHGFCTQDQPLTRYVHDGICASFNREFDRQREACDTDAEGERNHG